MAVGDSENEEIQYAEPPDLAAARARYATGETNFLQSLAGDEDQPRASLTGGNISPALALMPMLAQMQQAQTPFAQGANAFLNGFYGAQGMRNPNPPPQVPSALQMFQMIHTLYKDQETAKNQANIQAMREATAERLRNQAADLQEERARTQARREGDAAIEFGKMAITHQDENVRLAGAQSLIAGYEKKGVPTPDNILQGLATKQFNDEEVKHALDLMAIGTPDSYFLGRGWSPKQIEELRGPAALLFDEKRTDREQKAANLLKTDLDNIKNQNPELNGEGARFFVKELRDRGLTTQDLKDLPRDQIQAMADRSLLAQNQQTMKMEQQKSNIILGREKEMAAVNLGKAKELELFKMANHPASLSGKIFMDQNGQTPSQAEMKLPEVVLAQKYQVVTPKEYDMVNNFQMMKTMIMDVRSALKDAYDRGLTTERKGFYGTVPVLGPIAETLAKNPEVQKRTLRNPEDLAALNLLQQKKSNMVTFGRAQGDIVRALAAIKPDMDAIGPENSYAGGVKVLNDMERELKSQLSKSRVPGAWDARPSPLADTSGNYKEAKRTITREQFQEYRSYGLPEADLLARFNVQ